MYGSNPIYLQICVVGEIVAHQIQHQTDQKVGRIWGKKAREYPKTSFYSRGAEQSLDRLMKSGTSGPLTPRYLIQSLQSSPEQAAGIPPRIERS